MPNANAALRLLLCTLSRQNSLPAAATIARSQWRRAPEKRYTLFRDQLPAKLAAKIDMTMVEIASLDDLGDYLTGAVDWIRANEGR